MKSTVLLLLSVGATLAWDFTRSVNKFAASVYKTHALTTKGNFLLSPYSAGTVLSLTQRGAKGETAEEIRQSLSLPPDDNATEFSLPKLSQDQPYSLHSATKIYLKEGYEIKADFRKTAEDAFESEVEEADFSKREEAAMTMNQWVSNKTEHKIENLVEPEMLNNRTRALLLNALSFKGNWSTPFHRLFTFRKDFHSDHGLQVDMMHDFDATYDYLESVELDAKFLRMPFEGENASMTFVLPRQKDGLYNLEQQIDQVLDADNFTMELVSVALPRFRMETRLDMKKLLKSLGVNKAFVDGEADFSGIAGNPGDLFISDVVQKSFIMVDEDGVEAASATFIIKIFNRNGDPPKEFMADHPFLFYIKVEDLVVFIGRVVTPVY